MHGRNDSCVESALSPHSWQRPRSSSPVAATAAAAAATETGSSSEGGSSESVCESADGDGPKIGLAYDVGGRGDLSFNDSAFAGVEQAVEELDATCQEAEAQANESEADREERLRLLADAGFNPIIAVGFVYSPSAAKVAEEYPDTDFAVVDGYSTFITGDRSRSRTSPTSTSPRSRARSSSAWRRR